jgi:hypothetical protein
MVKICKLQRFGCDQWLEMQQVDDADLNQLRLRQWRRHSQDRLVCKEDSALRHRIDVTCKAQCCLQQHFAIDRVCVVFDRCVQRLPDTNLRSSIWLSTASCGRRLGLVSRCRTLLCAGKRPITRPGWKKTGPVRFELLSSAS